MSSLSEALEASRQKLRLCNGSLVSYFASSASISWTNIWFVGTEFGDEYQKFGFDTETYMVLPWGEFKLKIDDLQAAPSDTLFLLNLKLTAEEAGGLWASLRGFTHLTHLAVTEVIVDNFRRSDVIEGLLGAVSVLNLKTLGLFMSPSASNGVDGAEAFASALLRSESFPPSHRLQHLSLIVFNNMGIGEDCMLAVANTVQESSIPLLGIQLSKGVQDWQLMESQAFLMMLDTNKSLKALSLSRFRMTDQQLIELLKRLEALASLEALNLSRCKGFTASRKVVGTVVDFLSSARGQHVRQLEFRDTPLAGNPAIEAQLARNRATHQRRLEARQKAPGRAARLFICGEPFAGKTTLLKSMQYSSKLSSIPLGLRKVASFFPPSVSSRNVQRTQGIDVQPLVKDGLQLTLWDMAGDSEYHAFHDHMFPDPTAEGSPAFFLFVWSPVTSKNASKGTAKTSEDYEMSLCYWMKFIASKSKQSAVPRRVIVAITRKDQMDDSSVYLRPATDRLRENFKAIVELEPNVFEVDARNITSISPLLSCIFNTARELLHNREVYSLCDDMKKILRQKMKHECGPIISWEEFESHCGAMLIGDSDVPLVAKAIATSLNESGDLIFLHDMDFLILDVKWFCTSIMGELIHFSLGDRNFTVQGAVSEQYLVTLLQRKITVSRYHNVDGNKLIQLMEKLHLCCRLSDTEMFIPSTLPISPPETKQWQEEQEEDVTLLGRRLECRRKDLTFITPGFFHMLQVLFTKAFHEIGAQVELGKGFISIHYQSVHMFLKFCKSLGENVVDVLVRMSGTDTLNSFHFVEEVIRTITRICAEPVGDQGVDLVEAVIHPDCLNTSSFQARENQIVSLDDLKNDLLKQLRGIIKPVHDLSAKTAISYKWKMQEGAAKANYLEASPNNYKWKMQEGAAKANYLEASPFIDLLGAKEMSRVVMEYKESLQAVAKETGILSELGETSAAAAETSGPKFSLTEMLSLRHGDDGAAAVPNDTSTESVAVHSELLAKVLSSLNRIESKVDKLEASIRTDIKQIVTLRDTMLFQLHKKIDQILNLGVEKEAGRLPRLCLLTTEGVGSRRKLVASLSGNVLKSLHVELFCEHRPEPHRVKGQQGLTVTIVDNQLVRNMLPYVVGLLKVLGFAAKVGAHVVLGMSPHSMPDLAKVAACVLDAQGVLDLQNMHGVDFQNSELHEGSMVNFEGWEQWLVSVLQKNGGVSGNNIYQMFKLRRARYTDTSQVAWLCDAHVRSGKASLWPLVP